MMRPNTSLRRRRLRGGEKRRRNQAPRKKCARKSLFGVWTYIQHYGLPRLQPNRVSILGHDARTSHFNLYLHNFGDSKGGDRPMSRGWGSWGPTIPCSVQRETIYIRGQGPQ